MWTRSKLNIKLILLSNNTFIHPPFGTLADDWLVEPPQSYNSKFVPACNPNSFILI